LQKDNFAACTKLGKNTLHRIGRLPLRMNSTDIKLVAIDMDGTTLRTDGGISVRTIDTIRQVLASGIHVVPATGRPLSEVPDEILSLPGMRYAIVSNGASVMDLESGLEIFADQIPLPTAKELFAILFAENIAFESYSEGVSFSDERYMNDILHFFGALGSNFTWMIERMRFVHDLPAYFEKSKRSVEKIYVHHIERDARDQLARKLQTLPSIGSTFSDHLNIEINSATANKGAALRELCLHAGLVPQQVMAIGDGNNDLPMLEFAGLSVAMGNSVTAAKQMASYVTVSNKEDGVAVAMSKFLLR
jgi:Cof subfamily protein (haloacid dehalogenase superfamily)